MKVVALLVCEVHEHKEILYFLHTSLHQRIFMIIIREITCSVTIPKDFSAVLFHGHLIYSKYVNHTYSSIILMDIWTLKYVPLSKFCFYRLYTYRNQSPFLNMYYLFHNALQIEMRVVILAVKHNIYNVLNGMSRRRKKWRHLYWTTSRKYTLFFDRQV